MTFSGRATVRLCTLRHFVQKAGPQVSVPLASWHDDLVLVVATDHPDALLPGVFFAVRRVHDLLAQRNLHLNPGAGKTEVFCIPAGKGSAPLRKLVSSPQFHSVPFSLT